MKVERGRGAVLFSESQHFLEIYPRLVYSDEKKADQSGCGSIKKPPKAHSPRAKAEELFPLERTVLVIRGTKGVEP